MTENRSDLDDTDVAPGTRTVTLADLIRVPARRWRLPLLGALLGLLAGVGYLLLPASYTATAVVAVRPVVTDPFSYPGPGADRVVNMTVENGLATGTEVVTGVATATGQSRTDARDGLTVELPTGSQVLRFRYAAPSADQAITGANAAANTYLSTRQSFYQKQRDAIVKSYGESITKLTAEREKARKGLPDSRDGGATPADTAKLERVRSLDDQIDQITEKRADAAAVNVTPGSVTQIAEPPVSSTRDAGVLYALLALVGGALAGAVAAFAAEAIDRRIRTAADAAAATRFPILAELRGRRFSGHHDKLAGDLRYLALAVLGQLGPVPHRRIVLIGATAGDRAPGVATGLALALAEQGNTVRWEDLTADPAARARVLSAATGPVIEQLPEVPKADPDQTVRLQLPKPVLVGERKSSAVAVGAGRIWLDPPANPDEAMITVVQVAPAEQDDRGVRAALEAAAVVVVRRDRTRAARLERLASTLRVTGVRCLGVVLVSGRD